MSASQSDQKIMAFNLLLSLRLLDVDGNQTVLFPLWAVPHIEYVKHLLLLCSNEAHFLSVRTDSP